MARATGAISAALVIFGATCADAQEGGLQRVRDDISAPASNDKDKRTSSDSCSTRSGDDGLGSSFFNGLLLVPFYVPMGLLQDGYEFPLIFTPHPYAGGYHGYQIMQPDWANTYYNVDTADIPRKSWAVRIAIEEGNDFAGMNRLGGHVKLEHQSRWGIVSNWNYFRENLGNGRSDETVVGDTNVTFRFAQNEMVSMYAGLGLRVLTDRRQTDFGFNFIYGGDWFPVRPFIVSGQFDAGNLGSATVFHVHASIGAIWHGAEIFAGYDLLQIGSTNLHGPLAGVRFWF